MNKDTFGNELKEGDDAIFTWSMTGKIVSENGKLMFHDTEHNNTFALKTVNNWAIKKIK